MGIVHSGKECTVEGGGGGESVPNMIKLDINDVERLARQPITRERTEQISHRDL